jgi:hypothetical protein
MFGEVDGALFQGPVQMQVKVEGAGQGSCPGIEMTSGTRMYTY